MVKKGKKAKAPEKRAAAAAKPKEERALPATGGGRRPEHTEERALPATGGGRRPEHTATQQKVAGPKDVVQSKPMRLGIDFGTTHTVVALVDRGNYPIVSFEHADYVPS